VSAHRVRRASVGLAGLAALALSTVSVADPPLIHSERSLYRQVEQGQAIPYELYAAVAAILAWLYRRDVEERIQRERAEAAARGRKNPGGSAQANA